MTTAFPGAIDAYAAKHDHVDPIAAADVNNLQDAVVALEGQLKSGMTIPLVVGAGPWLDPKHPAFAGGAKGDGAQVTDAAMGAGATHVTSATGMPTAAIGKVCGYTSAGVLLFGTITQVNSNNDVSVSFTNPGGALSNGLFFWMTDDTAALTAWLNAVIPNGTPSGGAPAGSWGLLPPGLYGVTAAYLRDQQGVGAFKLVGGGLGGAGGGPTLIRCASAALAGQQMFTVNNMKNGVVRDLVIDGFFTANRGWQTVEGVTGPPPAPPSAETSTNNRFEDLYITQCVDYQLYLDGTEDSVLYGVHLAAVVNLDHNALLLNVPSGTAHAVGCFFAGRCWLSYQSLDMLGCTMGPVFENNPNSLVTLCLTLINSYLYDSANANCLQAVDRFTDTVAVGCFIILSNQQDWVRGSIIANVGLIFTGCGFLTGSTAPTFATVYCVTATSPTNSRGAVIFMGCSGSASGTQTSRNAFRTINAGGAYAIMLGGSMGNSFIPPDSLILAKGNTPGSGVAAINSFPFALEMVIDVNGATLTAPWLQLSPDNVTYTDAGFPPTAAVVTKMLRPGHFTKFTYSAGQPKITYWAAA